MSIQRFFGDDSPLWPRSARLLLAAMLIMSLGVIVPLEPLRVLVVLPIALLAPGYAAVVALFGASRRLDLVPLLALSCLLSVAIYPLLALLLYTSAILISPISVLAGIDVIVLLLVAVALARTRANVPTATLGGTVIDAVAPGRSLWQAPRGGALFTTIIAVVIAALAVAIHVLPTATDPSDTEFFLANQWALVHSTVYKQPGRPLTVSVGITNYTHHTQTYHIVPLVDNRPAWQPQDVTVGSGDTSIGPISGAIPSTGCLHRLSITLSYTSGSRTTTLSPLTLWVHGTLHLPMSCVKTYRVQ